MVLLLIRGKNIYINLHSVKLFKVPLPSQWGIILKLWKLSWIHNDICQWSTSHMKTFWNVVTDWYLSSMFDIWRLFPRLCFLVKNGRWKVETTQQLFWVPSMCMLHTSSDLIFIAFFLRYKYCSHFLDETMLKVTHQDVE